MEVQFENNKIFDLNISENGEIYNDIKFGT